MTTSRRRELINYVANLPVLSQTQRARVLRRAGVLSADSVEIASGFRITGHDTLTLGQGCYLNFGVYVDCEAPVVLEDWVGLAPGAKVITSHHDIPDAPLSATDSHVTGSFEPRPVRICHHVWIGANAVVLPGVTIGSNCVVGANAVVTRDCDPGGVYAGIPARRVRSVPGWVEPARDGRGSDAGRE